MQLDFLQEETSSAKTIASPHSKKTKPIPTTERLIVQTLLPVPELQLPSSGMTEDDETEKAPGAFKTISEAAAILDVPQHVLRFWESRFSQIKPLKMRGGRRYYRPEDMQILVTIKNLLYKQGYTIKGAKKAFSARPKEIGQAPPVPAVMNAAPPAAETVAERKLTDKQHSQLAVIRQELLGLRETLKTCLEIDA